MFFSKLDDLNRTCTQPYIWANSNGDMVAVETRRGSIAIMARSDKAVAEDMIFVPFAYVEAAANILTNPQVDPYGKIPEFKFAACRVKKIGAVAAE